MIRAWVPAVTKRLVYSTRSTDGNGGTRRPEARAGKPYFICIQPIEGRKRSSRGGPAAMSELTTAISESSRK